MKEKPIKLDLPDFAFLDGNCHLGNTLESRNVVMHIRSGSVVEFFHCSDVLLNEDVISVDFDYFNAHNIMEKFVCALHFSSFKFDSKISAIENVLLPAIDWFKKYLLWEDDNILEDDKKRFLASEN